MASGHLVTDRNLSLLGNIAAHDLIDTGRHLVSILAVKDFDVDHDAGFAMRNLEGGISDFADFFAENGAQQPFLGRQLSLALRGNLADQNVSGMHFGADTDHARRVEVLSGVLGKAGNIPRDFLVAELCLPLLELILLNVDRCKDVVPHQPFI
ncbi:hypothetical protein SDC9_66808 [bioreactor metagenome]|uniref:Uncharacterized protein n=1 Tax=bioreactor metagenome TaxID=1076179 RepID=A0A644XWA5_9ZZZZ